jgi:arginyl-tRNA synthetase
VTEPAPPGVAVDAPAGADAIRLALSAAARELGAPETVDVILERPRDPAFGDWTTNLAMTLARHLRQKPRDIADALVGRMDLAGAGVRAAEVAGAGFLNFRLDPAFVARGLAPVVEAGDAFGRDAAWAGERVVVEFVSANPTGPLHVGHGRQAALGDAISTLLAWQGFEVSREFYYNDAGAQIENLARSVWARMAERAGVEAAVPEGGYHGEYIAEIADDFVRARDAAGEPAVDVEVLRAGAAAIAAGQRPADAELFDAVRSHAVAALRAEQDLDLRAFGVAFDTYYLESSLYTGRAGGAHGPGARRRRRDVRAGRRAVPPHHALRRRQGPRDAPERGQGRRLHVLRPRRRLPRDQVGARVPRAINVQGSDHHGTTARVRAGLQALGAGIPRATRSTCCTRW